MRRLRLKPTNTKPHPHTSSVAPSTFTNPTQQQQIINKAKHYLEDPHHAHEVLPAPWISACILAGLWGLGLPAIIYALMRRRRRQHVWVADKAAPDGGRYEPATLLEAEGEARGRERGAEGEDDDGVGDDDALAFSFLELEQQVRFFCVFGRARV